MNSNHLLLISFLIAFVFSVHSKAQETLVMAYGHDYKPFAWQENGEMRGLQVDIIKEVLEKRLGFTVQHLGFPWKRAQLMVETGKADGLITFPSEARLAFSNKTAQALIANPIRLYTYKNHPRLDQLREINSLSQISGFQIVDYLGDGWAQDNLSGFNVTWLSEMKDCLKYLALGRADLFIQSSIVTNYNIKELGLKDQIEKMSILAASASHHLMLSKSSKFNSKINQIDEVISSMISDGSLEKIKDIYR